jgi:hypothetical protein
MRMGYLFFQRLGALSRHLVTGKGDLGCSEDALHWVDEDPIPLKSVTVWDVGSCRGHQCGIAEV